MRTTLRPCVCRRALSPLLDGPFLMSPRRRQSATAGPLPPAPDIKSDGLAGLRAVVASGAPTRRGPHRGPCAGLPAGLLASGCWCISTHRVSIRPSHPSADAVSRLAPASRLFSRPDIAIDSLTLPQASLGLSALSLTHIRVV